MVWCSGAGHVVGRTSSVRRQTNAAGGVRVGGIYVGSMDHTAALRLVDKKLDALKQRRLLLTDSDSSAQDIKLTLGEAGIHYKAEAFRNAVKALSSEHLWTRVQTRFSFEKEWSITSFRQEEILRARFGVDWEEQRYGMPINAVRQIDGNDHVRYIPGRSARRLDWPRLDAALDKALPKDFTDSEEPVRVELPFRQLEPKISVDSLRNEGIERKIVQFSTSLGSSSEGRVYNVNSAASTVDGLILKPGDIFDYGQLIAKAERTHGFREAPVIVNGQLESGIGGGICQVSSTVYNAALRVGLDIVERRNHSLPVSYLPKGQDATLLQGPLIFVLETIQASIYCFVPLSKTERLLLNFLVHFHPMFRMNWNPIRFAYFPYRRRDSVMTHFPPASIKYFGKAKKGMW